MRYAGDAPAPPRWQRGVLLIDEYRLRNLVQREGFAPSQSGCRPEMLLLHHRWSWYCANLSGFSDPQTSIYLIQRKKGAYGRSCTSDVYPRGTVLQTVATHLTVASYAWVLVGLVGWWDLHPRSPASEVGALVPMLQPVFDRVLRGVGHCP